MYWIGFDLSVSSLLPASAHKDFQDDAWESAAVLGLVAHAAAKLVACACKKLGEQRHDSQLLNRVSRI
jgi:hypothetical protein